MTAPIHCGVSDKAQASLYRRVLGPRWDDLPESLKRIHSTFAPQPIRGRFTIRNGTGRGVQMLAWLLRMPRATDSAEVTLLVHRVPESEIWVRTFDRRTVTTKQSNGPMGTLQERFGVFEFSFNLEAADGQLKYHQQNAAIRLGFVRFDLPAFMSPRLYATEKVAAGRQDVVEVAVEVRLPSTRLLIAYAGTISFSKDDGS